MKSKNILKNLSAIGLSDVIGTGATAFFWFYLASVISPENYGEIFFYLGIATLISSIVLIANQNTITVYLAKKIKLQSTLYVITLIATVIASFVIIFWFYRVDIIFVLIGFVFNTLAIGELLGRRKYSNYSKHKALPNGARHSANAWCHMILIFGVIIDTFADLRSEKQQKEEILKNSCFIFLFLLCLLCLLKVF